HSRYPASPMTVHAAAIPTRRGVHPQSATSPPQPDGETDCDATERMRRAAQIRSRHAPGVCSGSFSTGPAPLAHRERRRLWVLAASVRQGTHGTGATSPPGPAWFYVYQIKVIGSSRMSGQFAALGGDVVNLYVFGEKQYELYAFIGWGHGLFSVNGSSGSFAID